MPDPAPLPIGSRGRLEAVPLANPGGQHAILVREGERPRALVAAALRDGDEQLLVTPLDEEVDVRVDGDALALFIASGSVLPVGHRVAAAPGWATAIGMVLLVAMLLFAVLGSFTFFTWLFGLFGVAR